MPALTISTDIAMRSRSSSPNPPPMSPITPTLAPTRLPGDDGNSTTSNNAINSNAGGLPPPAAPAPAAQLLPAHPTFAHSQADQIGVPPPPPLPISFDSNPDAIALMSTISVLQVQRRRATADIQALSRAKNDAIAHPEEFLRDLVAGKVGSEGDAPRRQSVLDSSGGDSDDSDDDDDDDNCKDDYNDSGNPAGEASSSSSSSQQPRAWTALPKPQSVVRCPPINWSQYAVVGESLDKLHAEQLARPTQGTPAVIGAGGMYEFRGGDGKQEKYNGVAAPYSPLRDKIDRKPKGRK